MKRQAPSDGFSITGFFFNPLRTDMGKFLLLWMVLKYSDTSQVLNQLMKVKEFVVQKLSFAKG